MRDDLRRFLVDAFWAGMTALAVVAFALLVVAWVGVGGLKVCKSD